MNRTMHGRFTLFTLMAVLVPTLLAVPADAAQSRRADSSRADSTRLDRLRRDIQAELRRLDDQPSATSDRLREQLEDLRDEVGYLRISQRRGETIEDREYQDLESKLQNLRYEMRNASARTSGGGATYDITVGTELDVRLQNALSSETAMVEDRFDAATVVDLYENERLIVPAGSMLRGVISEVDRASRTDRQGSLKVTFDQMTVRGRTYDIRANVVEAIDAGLKGEVGKIGAGAGVGAIIGGILGGTKGALAGILIGAGGTVLATEGNDVDLPVGTVLRVRFESPVEMAPNRVAPIRR